MAIEWNDAWNIGHAKIDEQHRNWVRAFNRLENAVLSDDDQYKDEVQKQTLEEMAQYTDHHFSTEESLMLTINYPESVKHWRLHKNFNDELYEHLRDSSEGKLVFNSRILSLFRHWILDHIQTEDQKLGEFLRSQDR